jgi:hypothetical protein
MRDIGGKTVPLYAPLAFLMSRMAAHFGRFSAPEPANEPTKTQGIDERTQDSDERTRKSANEPEVRLVAPARPYRLRINGLPAALARRLSQTAARPKKTNPRPLDPPNDPGA